MIYRAVKELTKVDVPARQSARVPGNINFYVDNIWEWLRPEDMPSRRHSAFASPCPKIAAQAIGGTTAEVYRVEPALDARFCQLVQGDKPDDAKYHSDCILFKKLIIKPFQEHWITMPLEKRLFVAPLFMPCASKDEIDVVMGGDHPWDVNAIKVNSSFWDDVEMFDPHDLDQCPHPTGEIMFEGAYRLVAN